MVRSSGFVIAGTTGWLVILLISDPPGPVPTKKTHANLFNLNRLAYTFIIVLNSREPFVYRLSGRGRKFASKLAACYNGNYRAQRARFGPVGPTPDIQRSHGNNPAAAG
jgi:hypothetical protein